MKIALSTRPSQHEDDLIFGQLLAKCPNRQHLKRKVNENNYLIVEIT